MELLISNIVYVAYRLVVTAHIIKFLNRYVNYYVAVLIAAQVSFLYDNGIFAWLFSAQDLPRIADLIYADIKYTIRVIAAWWLIKQIWDFTKNYYFAVFVGAEITFFVDYFIFSGIYV